MNITTVKIKEYGSSWKYVLIINGNPVCIVRSNKALNACISYLMNGEPVLKDGHIMKLLDKFRKKVLPNDKR